MTRGALEHRVGEREPDGERQPAADDGVAAVEARASRRRGASSRRGRGCTPRALPNISAMTALALHAARERVTVLAIGRDDGVVRAERRHHADGDRLLADVEVQEAADLARAVELGALLLEAADAQHLAQQGDARASGVVAAIMRCPPASRVSPSGRPSSRALSRRRMILPLRVRGSVREEVDLLRRDGGAEALAREARAARSASASLGREARLQRDERLHDLHGDRIGLADDARLGDGGVLQQRALHLERADEVPRRLDDVVRPADEPEVAVGVAPARSPVRYQPPAKHFAIALVLVQVAAEHRRPAGAKRELALDVRRLDHLDARRRRVRAHDRRPRRPAAAAPSSRAGSSIAAKLAIMIPPVSVCHQLSWIGQAERLVAPDHGLRVERLADARDEAQLREVVARAQPPRRPRISMRIAVGAVYQTVTRSSLEDAVPALGVEVRLVDDASSRRS